MLKVLMLTPNPDYPGYDLRDETRIHNWILGKQILPEGPADEGYMLLKDEEGYYMIYPEDGIQLAYSTLQDFYLSLPETKMLMRNAKEANPLHYWDRYIYADGPELWDKVDPINHI